MKKLLVHLVTIVTVVLLYHHSTYALQNSKSIIMGYYIYPSLLVLHFLKLCSYVYTVTHFSWEKPEIHVAIKFIINRKETCTQSYEIAL